MYDLDDEIEDLKVELDRINKASAQAMKDLADGKYHRLPMIHIDTNRLNVLIGRVQILAILKANETQSK